MVSFPEAVKRGFQGSVTWRGRSTRAEYWWFQFFVLLLLGVPFFETNGFDVREGPWFVVGVVVEIATALPLLAVTIRRLHDSDRSGWNVWVTLVPCVGGIWLMILLLEPSAPRQNRFD